jgi:hypothetical protein
MPIYIYIYGFCKMFLYKKSEEEFLYFSLFSLLFSKSYFLVIKVRESEREIER